MPGSAAFGYATLIAVLIYVAAAAIIELSDRRAALASATETLGRLQAYREPGSSTAADAASGSAFLEGPTVTVAGAALLQRIAGAVSRVAGNIMSSHVDLHGTQSAAGFIAVTVNCELEQPALQQLLHDIEAGMPYLFVEQLEVQVPSTAVSSPQGRLRVTLTVSGQWQGAR